MIPLFKVFMSPEATTNVAEVLKSGYIGEGPKVKQFEKALQRFLGCGQTPLATNSCTSALTLAVRLSQSEGKNEVLCPPLTCTATGWAILAAGSTIRWVDVSTCDGCISMEDAVGKLSPRTSAIMVVDWGGTTLPEESLYMLRDTCYRRYGHRPYIIHDAAHAFGSNLPINDSSFMCFSFQAIKTLTTGDGGALLCPNSGFTERARLMRWFGLDRESSSDFRCAQNVTEWGYKFHMNDIAASIGLANLQHTGNLVTSQIENANFYDANLKTFLNLYRVPGSSCWLYSIAVANRDRLHNLLKENGIQSSPVHSRIDKHLCVKNIRETLKGMDILDKTLLCIPSGWWVTDEQREKIADVVNSEEWR